MKIITIICILAFYQVFTSCSKPDDSKIDNSYTLNTPDSLSSEIKIIKDIFAGKSLVVISKSDSKFIVSFFNENNYIFEAVQDSLPIIMKDSEGNFWDINGVAVEGSRKGTQLASTKSFMGYWFAWGTFFQGAEIYNDDRTETEVGRSYLTGDWLIPSSEVHDGGPGKDGIPALSNPQMLAVENATYLQPADLILGYVSGNEARAYPHKILDWHEIVNDQVDGKNLVITYCPLTGTGVGWLQELSGTSSSFGVSGLLYNSNLMPYDRETDSYWSQMRLDCVKGTRKGVKIQTIQLIETTWETWSKMYPNTKVISTNTGYSRDYNNYPYGSYKTKDQLFFPVSFDDNRLHQKEIVHGVIINDRAKVYRFSHFNL